MAKSKILRATDIKNGEQTIALEIRKSNRKPKQVIAPAPTEEPVSPNLQPV
jgi:hypothetical protein